MDKRDDFLLNQLNARRKNGLLRTLPIQQKSMIDFDSNDFLGLTRNEELKNRVIETIEQNRHALLFGSSGSRLVSGNVALFNEVEEELSQLFKAESTLLFKSGFEANQSFFGYVPSRTDTVIYDAEIHASIKTAVRLSGAACFSFRHNDLDDLEQKAARCTGRIFVAVESIYSISGHEAPLTQLAALSEKKGWLLVVDEAHSTGVAGENGAGLCCELNIFDKVFARIHTFGKAPGCAGAIVAGSKILKEYLVNFAVPFIYSTAMPPVQALVIREHLCYIAHHPELKQALQENINHFISSAPTLILESKAETANHIMPLHFQDAQNCLAATNRLKESGFSVKAMLPPTTSGNVSLIRLTLHADNNFGQIDNFFSCLRKLL